jgi:hypothetical protein
MSLTDDQPHTRVRLPGEPRQPAPAPRPPWFTGLTVLAVITLVIVAVAFANRGGSAPLPGKGGTSHGKDTVPGGARPPQTTRSGIAVGFARTQSGAASAAANYVVALGSAQMFRTASRHQIVVAIADPAIAAQLREQFNRSYTATLATFGLDTEGNPPRGQTFVSRALPVGTAVVSYSDDRAVVDVWSAGIIGLAGEKSTKPVTEAWSTTTVTLRWVDGDWKWAGSTHREGPTPVSGLQAASSAEDIARATARFGELRYAR